MAAGRFLPEMNMENQMEKQMGCMTGLLQIFDRHQILAGKRLHSTKRLLPPPVVDTISESEVLAEARESGKLKQQVPPEFPTKGRMSYKETPRLSLDSRATTDEKGGLHAKEVESNVTVRSSSNGDTQVYRSHTLIAKLMGLEPLPNSYTNPKTEKKPELRRSSSESGASVGFLHSRFIMESNNFPAKQQNQSHTPIFGHEASVNNPWRDENNGVNLSPWKAPQHGQSCFFDSPKQNVSAQEETEKRLKMRGIEEPTKDLETLKNILEALQLQGLLHTTKPAERNHHTRHQKFVYDESPIVVMKPSRTSVTSPIHRRTENEYPPERQFRRNNNSPQRARQPNSLVKPKPLSVETQRRATELPKHRITGSDPMTRTRPPRSKKVNNWAEDESASISTSTSTDTERSRTEGKNLLERCDKLLHSIAEMTAAADMQPSPVSVLDSSLYRDDSLPASPIAAKRKIHFKDISDHYSNVEEETWSTGVSPINQETPKESDFLYVSDIISASNLFPAESDLFHFLEKQQFQKGQGCSYKASRLGRRAVFDTITEILKWIRRLPPWKNVSWTTDDVSSPSLNKVWLEFQRIRDQGDAEEMYDIVCGVLKKDLDGDEVSGWRDFPTEISDTILDLERLIFKDLVGEALRDLAALTSENRLSRINRKKVLWK